MAVSRVLLDYLDYFKSLVKLNGKSSDNLKRRLWFSSCTRLLNCFLIWFVKWRNSLLLDS